MSEIEVVKAFMDRVNSRDLRGALELVRSDVIVNEPYGLPYGGVYHGHEELAGLMRQIGRTWSSWSETCNRYASSDGMVVRETVVTACFRDTGDVIEMPFVEVFEVNDGLITGIRPHYFDPTLIPSSQA